MKTPEMSFNFKKNVFMIEVFEEDVEIQSMSSEHYFNYFPVPLWMPLWSCYFLWLYIVMGIEVFILFPNARK